MTTRDVTGLSELHALLGEGATFEGTLTFEGRVRIDGHFRGQVKSPGVLILGQRADVDAHVEVGTLIVLGGTLHGDVQAQKSVELHPDAKVYANVCAPQLMIDRGAVFEGQSRQPQPEPEQPDGPEQPDEPSTEPTGEAAEAPPDATDDADEAPEGVDEKVLRGGEATHD